MEKYTVTRKMPNILDQFCLVGFYGYDTNHKWLLAHLSIGPAIYSYYIFIMFFLLGKKIGKIK
jgi:hypothetical protein